MVGEEIQIPIAMGWFSIYINNESIILASNQGVQESDLLIIFFFNSEGDVLIDSIECVMERVDCISFNDAKTIVNKPVKTLQQEFPSPKSQPPIELQPNVVYKISCADCPGSYVGETGRCFETRNKEHMRNVMSYARGSNIAKHAWSSNHSIDFKNSQVIDKGSSHIRKTLESWHTVSTDHADNNSKLLPNQYSILLKKNN